MMHKAKYFVAVFGDPRVNKEPVESGIYTPDPHYAPLAVKLGDVMLLYCTVSYAAYPMQIPGTGIALRVNRETIEYRWIPYVDAIPTHVIDVNFEPGDLKQMRDIRFTAGWLFEISKQSFSKTVGDRLTAWGRV